VVVIFSVVVAKEVVAIVVVVGFEHVGLMCSPKQQNLFVAPFSQQNGKVSSGASLGHFLGITFGVVVMNPIFLFSGCGISVSFRFSSTQSMYLIMFE
jgi:hypothetical protein